MGTFYRWCWYYGTVGRSRNKKKKNNVVVRVANETLYYLCITLYYLLVKPIKNKTENIKMFKTWQMFKHTIFKETGNKKANKKIKNNKT